MKVAARSMEPTRPFENLMPIVDALVAAGNSAIDGGFVLNPDGWRCRLANRIDFDLVRSALELPATIQTSDSHDAILDRLSWCVIEGPGAHDR